jgi:hypothetical protein
MAGLVGLTSAIGPGATDSYAASGVALSIAHFAAHGGGRGPETVAVINEWLHSALTNQDASRNDQRFGNSRLRAGPAVPVAASKPEV